ncbi:MAG: bifunctional 2-C-methyl-D-erythritol 4-phosphate cytidylyltransferase/2-C-methyl-D-erythritol 2,4-cyclodiphosphate synthase [Sphingobium sp.]|nr:bifunctional 2-C-methyl-D-erythritol 4-phosphate cytidylyltransferase/2-C-methyl-D-erythritol 2,4-cyclodiphosphate synthase [Sphingobium sp.]MCP5398922.1 bifunctional 2-C-methyl-D-erythritol 4-phosphate cytidylyltransferase/2-C-methyl-D-erythritol 2,4-cyclodiphosphate synthase [Sphingomonas sp.]
MTDKNIAAIIVAAGSGSRSGLDTPKQYALLDGKAVLAHSYTALQAHPRIGTIVIAIGAGQEEMARDALASGTGEPILVVGGDTRRASVLAALETLEALGNVDAVLIHDAARPILPAAVIERLVEALGNHHGAIPALPVADTLVQGAGALMADNVERAGLYRVQTPQAFDFATILNAHRTVAADAGVTDDAGLLRALDIPVALVQGDAMLEKLTYPADFARAEVMMMTQRMPRVGSGYDVHRLVEGKPLWLCGIEIPHDRGLSGHSDADVAIHALVDALLGALAEGDIGSHFPPSDPQWKGAESHQFLTFARDRVSARGGEIAHVDITIICEAPKIGPHKDAMRMRLAELLNIPIDRVSVKATTTERLGYTGRKEGIAAQAVATLLLPIL